MHLGHQGLGRLFHQVPLFVAELWRGDQAGEQDGEQVLRVEGRGHEEGNERLLDRVEADCDCMSLFRDKPNKARRALLTALHDMEQFTAVEHTPTRLNRIIPDRTEEMNRHLVVYMSELPVAVHRHTP